MSFPNIYSKLKIIAEMEAHWDAPELIKLRVVEAGILSGTNHHPDQLRTIRDQIEFMRDIKKILLSNKDDKPLP